VDGRHAQPAAIAAAIGFVALGAFQLLLAVGAPLGHAAWGGDSAALSGTQRVGSAVSVAFYAVACVIVLNRSTRWAPWCLVLIFGVAALANVASESPWERYVLGPAAAVLAILCAVVARGRQPSTLRL